MLTTLNHFILGIPELISETLNAGENDLILAILEWLYNFILSNLE